MISPDAARNVVGIIGNVISFGLFLSPVPTFWRICKRKDVEEFMADPYLATLLNCMLWVFYGIPVVHPNSILVATINGIGLVVDLLPLLPQQEAPEDDGCAGRGVGVHGGGDTGRVAGRAHAREAIHDRRHPLRLLRLHHVLLPAHHHGEGDKDEERGVHAVLPVAGLLPQRRLLDGVRAHPLRHLRDHPQRRRRSLRRHPAHPLRLLLPDHTKEDQGGQGRRDALRRHLRPWCRRRRLRHRRAMS